MWVGKGLGKVYKETMEEPYRKSWFSTYSQTLYFDNYKSQQNVQQNLKISAEQSVRSVLLSIV